MTKKIVHFDPSRAMVAPRVGASAIVFPLDHYNGQLISNTKHVITSEVLVIDKSGAFETLNSRYVPKVPA